MFNYRKSIPFISLFLVLILFLAACGQAAEPKQTTDPKQPTSSQATEVAPAGEAASGQAKEGGAVIVGITQEPDSFDPHLAAAAGTKEIIYNFFDGLVKLMPDGSFEPALAEAYEQAEDAKTYTFKIRQGVKFHNGKDLTLDDVVYSLKNAAGLGPDGQVKQAQLTIIDDVIANPAEDTVEVSLKEPDADFISYMTLAIVPADYHEQATKPIGTGPFIFSEYKKQQAVKMVKNPDYWRDQKAYLDEVTFAIMPSADAAMVDLQAGNIDIFPYLTIDKLDLLKDKYDFITADSNMVQGWFLNNARPPFDQPDVRRALNMAIDKQLVIDTVTFGEGKVLESGMTSSMGKFYNSDLKSQYDPEEAKALLQKAGFENLEITITVPGNYVIHVQTAEALAAQLAKVGVKAKIQPVDWGTWLSDVYQGRNFDSTVIALTFDYLSPATVLKHYYSKHDSNFINYHNAQFDQLYEEAAAETDEGKRVDLYHQMQAILQEDGASVFLQNPGTQTAVSKKLGGYLTYPQYVQDLYPVHFVE